MKARYYGKEIELSDRFLNALCELMRANLEMMRNYHEEFADCWTWGVCIISDLAYRHIEYQYGGDEDRPDDLPKGQDVMVTVE